MDIDILHPVVHALWALRLCQPHLHAWIPFAAIPPPCTPKVQIFCSTYEHKTRNSSSPDSVKTELSPEEVEELDQAKDELFIQIYRKRQVYFERWRKVTLKHFSAVELHNKDAAKVQEEKVMDVIERYTNRINKRRENFTKKYPFEKVGEDKTLKYLNGLDKLVKPCDRLHRRHLIKKEREYHEKNQKLNPDTMIPQEDTSSHDGTPPANAIQGQEDSPCEDEEAHAASDWESASGLSNTDP